MHIFVIYERVYVPFQNCNKIIQWELHNMGLHHYESELLLQSSRPHISYRHKDEKVPLFKKNQI